MPTELDALVIGDSHSRALRAGCTRLGLNIEGMSAGGATWIEESILIDRDRGLRSTNNKRINRRLSKMATAVGTPNIFDGGVPVILSVFNLGRLSGTFRWAGHTAPNDPDMGLDADHKPVSQDFLREYVLDMRRYQLNLIRKAAKRADVIVVAPPPINETHTSLEMCKIMGDAVKEMNVRYFDPRDAMPENNPVLPTEHRHEDGRHGNEIYGQWVIEQIISSGTLDVAA